MRDLSDVLDRVGGPMSVAECEALADLAANTTAKRALEVGHFLGRSTSVLLVSLPESVEFVTIDHHAGDNWCPGTPFERFLDNVEPFVGRRKFSPINRPMADALPKLSGKFGFCFYDADHTAQAVAEFWDLAVDLLDDECTLCFDDADWVEQSTLRTLAESAGFEVVTDRPLWRGGGDKHDPETYTLEVMRRA